MAVKAILKIQLLADDVVVAESESPTLWYTILQAMQNDATGLPTVPTAVGGGVSTPHAPSRSETSGRASIESFAAELGLESPLVEGACAPTGVAPYIHLDRHHWEALRRNTGERGPKALAPAVLAATLLALWWKHAGQSGSPTIGDVTPVLETIRLSTLNLKRSLDNCRWLQLRGKAISLNPARTSAAVAVVRAYCLQQPFDNET